MIEPVVTVIQSWPAVMTAKVAAAYLDVSVSHLTTLTRTYPDRLRTLNLNPGGDVRFSRETLDEFIRWRESVGYERRAG